jgi:signal transduction histidine kinase
MTTQQANTPIGAGKARPWVLLVEDEPTVSKVVGKLLDESGYEHVSISDHNQIAAAILHWNPRCIILDSEPGSAGHERSWADAAAIRRAHPELPVLMFTADPSSVAEARAGTTDRSKAAGYAGVIDKPLLVVEFLATLKSAVDAPQSAKGQDTTGLAAEAIGLFPDLGGRSSTNWAVSDYFGIAVHELRTPLMSISGQAQLAQRYVDKDPKRASSALVKLLEQTRRMDRLIGDLLDYARVGSGALSLEVVTFDLGVATAITIAMHEHEDTPRITFTTPKGLRIQGDPDRIAQILGNIFDNALKYSPPGSPIDVSLTVVGSEAHIRVADHGLGIPDEERGPLFAPFFRTTRTRDIPGTGLGLHISRRIAEQHRGRLWLDSSNSVGSVFVLALPLASPN